MTSSCDPGRTRAPFAADPRRAEGSFARLGLVGNRAAEEPAPAAQPPQAPAAPPEAVDLASLRREAYEEGRAAALAELPWRDVEGLERARASLEASARALAELRSEYLRVHRSLCVELALAIAETVVARAADVDPQALVAVLERALARLGPEEPVRVRLARSDHEAVASGLAPELERLASEHALELVPDPDLASGDLVVEGTRARVDARRRELLHAVREELAALLDPGGRL